MMEATHPSWVIVVAVNAEYGNRNVQVFILVINPGEPINTSTLTQHSLNKNTMKTQERPENHSRTDLVVLKFTVWSLRMLNCMGESPMQYCLSIVMLLWRHRREGLLSWNKSPPSRMKSTCKSTKNNNNNIIVTFYYFIIVIINY